MIELSAGGVSGRVGERSTQVARPFREYSYPKWIPVKPNLLTRGIDPATLGEGISRPASGEGVRRNESAWFGGSGNVRDEDKTREELLAELRELRERISSGEAGGGAPALGDDVVVDVSRGEDFLRGILNSSTLVSIVLTDPDQNVLFWNTGAENIFGYRSEEMIGDKITKIYPPDSLSQETVERLRTMVRKGEGAVHGKMDQISKDGRRLTVSLALTPMRNRSGDVQGIVGVGLDVTEEVRQHGEILRLLDQVKNTQDVAIFTLARVAESRDEETGLHLMRMREYCRLLCDSLATRDNYSAEMTAEFIDDLVRSSVLHDIGKVAIPDEILLFQGKYSDEQFKIMTRHTVVGGRALEDAVERLGEESFLSIGRDVAYHHHERWDGTGYPSGLKGAEIPLSARIVAVTDVYDALTTERRYKKAFDHAQACNIIIQGKGTHFDPELIEAFTAVEGQFDRLRRES
jgi:PAS domain S-box-containing protein